MKAAVLSQEEAQMKDANRRDAGARITSHSVPVGSDEAQRGVWDGTWVWGSGADPECRGRGL